jgi:hypothetical protein
MAYLATYLFDCHVCLCVLRGHSNGEDEDMKDLPCVLRHPCSYHTRKVNMLKDYTLGFRKNKLTYHGSHRVPRNATPPHPRRTQGPADPQARRPGTAARRVPRHLSRRLCLHRPARRPPARLKKVV